MYSKVNTPQSAGRQMQILDNFLPAEIYTELWNHLQRLDTPLECPRDEEDHQGLQNCDRFAIEGEAKTLFMTELVNQDVCRINWLEPKYEMTYHRMKAPYYSHFHCDRLSDWHSDEIDYVGISFFMNDDWKYNDGGLFAWKQAWDSNRGEFVEPIQNRLIINPNDYPHAVTQITNPDVMRHSIQIFIAKEYVL